MSPSPNQSRSIEIDGQRILDDAREIAFPRYPGTEGDRRAIEIVVRRFRDAGLEVTEEQFSYDIRIAFRVIRFVLIGTALSVGASGLVAPFSVLWASVLIVASLLLGGVMLVWSPGAEKLYSRPGPTSTANVTGYRRAAQPRLSLILMAHHDSKSQNLPFHLRMGLTILSLVGGLAMALLLASAWLQGSLPGPVWLSGALGGAVALSLLVLSTLRSGNESPGGVDNAGSLAIVFELARTLPGELGPDVELIFLSPGAEEDHMVGAMRWLDAHRDELKGRPVYTLNFDGAGAPGRTVFIERYALGKPFSRKLSEVARLVARRSDVPFRGITMLPAMGIDAIPFAHQGLESLTFASGSLDKATISVHSANDVADHLDPEALARIARLARDVTVHLADSPD